MTPPSAAHISHPTSMPRKKHQPAFLSIKPTAVPSTPRTPAQPAAPPPQSVNDRITQLRREQTPRATPQRISEVTQVVSARTVPPQLRRLLHIPEVDAPLPKPGARRRALRAGERPPPGPAAPSSWLAGSGHATKGLELRGGAGTRPVSRLGRLAEIHDAEFKRLPRPRSLAHYALRSLAIRWGHLVEYEQYYLPTLPTHLKEALLSYLSLYRNVRLEYKAFKTLFGSGSEGQESGSEDVHFLDLTDLLNYDFSLRDLKKCLQRPTTSAAVASSTETASASQSTTSADAVADSWEDEADSAAGPAALPAALPHPFFPNLTRLSLAHPSLFTTWADLLSLAPHLATLTHLSLAYWPRPSTNYLPFPHKYAMTEKRMTMTLAPPFRRQDDWDLEGWQDEAASILRRLSLHTYCLTYLDLEGCDWLEALTHDIPRPYPVMPHSGGPDVMWYTPGTAPGPDWNGAWRRIERINVFQGWVPADRSSLQNLPASLVCIELMGWLRDEEKVRARRHVLDGGRSEFAVNSWVENERVARKMVDQVRRVRREAGGLWVGAEFGWGNEE